MELCGSEAIDLMRLIQTDGARLDKFIAGAIQYGPYLEDSLSNPVEQIF